MSVLGSALMARGKRTRRSFCRLSTLPHSLGPSKVDDDFADARSQRKGDCRWRGSSSVRSTGRARSSRRSQARWRPVHSGAADLAADVAELFRERELPPAPRRQIPVLNLVHGRTSRDTTAAIALRVEGSSTPRDRLPNDGRRLIIESNSSHSSPSTFGYRLMPHRSR